MVWSVWVEEVVEVRGNAGRLPTAEWPGTRGMGILPATFRRAWAGRGRSPNRIKRLEAASTFPRPLHFVRAQYAWEKAFLG
jgi:hypothetical protein